MCRDSPIVDGPRVAAVVTRENAEIVASQEIDRLIHLGPERPIDARRLGHVSHRLSQVIDRIGKAPSPAVARTEIGQGVAREKRQHFDLCGCNPGRSRQQHGCNGDKRHPAND
jgi:hypothetical protein